MFNAAKEQNKYVIEGEYYLKVVENSTKKALKTPLGMIFHIDGTELHLRFLFYSYLCRQLLKQRKEN